jgi:NTP pyrophosphatase (non-canonical NTP hydrolase)
MSINRITREDVGQFRRDHNLRAGNAMDSYQFIATKSALYPGQGTSLGLVYSALKGAGEAGEYAEHVGKAMRDDNLMPIVEINGKRYVELDGKPTGDRRELLIKEIGDKLWYLSAQCNELGICLSYAALMNLEKLCDRTERDALRGSGDER